MGSSSVSSAYERWRNCTNSRRNKSRGKIVIVALLGIRSHRPKPETKDDPDPKLNRDKQNPEKRAGRRTPPDTREESKSKSHNGRRVPSQRPRPPLSRIQADSEIPTVSSESTSLILAITSAYSAAHQPIIPGTAPWQPPERSLTNGRCNHCCHIPL